MTNRSMAAEPEKGEPKKKEGKRTKKRGGAKNK
jgi:hypothetical protein